MKHKKTTTISNILITIMLVFLFACTTTYSVNMVANYNNSDVIYNGNKQSNYVTLMFNVYWGNEYIDGILDCLNKYDIRTTFFVGGAWVEKNREILAKIISAGHEIGNHGYFHSDHQKLNYEQNYEEIKACNDLVNVYFGYKIKLFAPPSGAFNNATIEAAQALGCATIMWTYDTIDWRDKNSTLIYNRATKKVSGGSLVLMHPTEKTLEALPAILEYYKLNNLQVVTASQNISIE